MIVPAASIPLLYRCGRLRRQSGETTSAEVKCTIANTLATVAFSPELANVVTDYKVKIFTTTGELSFTESTVDSVGYYMLNGKDRSLAWSFEGKKTDGKNYTQSGIVLKT